jgi:phosphatidylinositol 4-kinase
LKALAEVQVEGITYLPSNPDAILIDIDYASATPMQSAAKAPFLARFRMKQCGVEVVERTAMDAYKREIEFHEPRRDMRSLVSDQHGFAKKDETIGWKAAIFKGSFFF